MSERAHQPNTRVLPEGSIEVSPRAIASLVAHAVTHSYGVVGMAPANLRDIHIVAAYGTRISEVAQQVISTVDYALKQSLGLPIAAINVHVEGVSAE
jgi:uncharacterized alkaline shock family protein YloU